MTKETISDKQAISMIVMFIIGSSIVFGVGSEAKQDIWLAIIIALIWAFIIMFIYVKIYSLFPEKNLFQIIDFVFGKYIGKFISLLYIWYSFHLGALVLNDTFQFIKVVSFPETPEYILLIFMGTVCIWAVKEGIEVLCRMSSFFIILLIIIIILVSSLSFSVMNINNLRPTLYNGINPVLNSAFGIFSFPFAETVIFLGVFNFEKSKNNPFRIYYRALLFGGAIIFILSLRNILVLGSSFLESLYFPSYTTVELIEIGEFLQRIEVAVSVVFLYAAFIKISSCLLCSCKGIENIFNLDSYKILVAPVGLLMMTFACNIYESIMEMMEWAFLVYKYYAFPFQVIIPLIILIIAKIKTKKQLKSI
ncbi:MAG: endospore germination permease [Caloramator sp.]|nr:endospore germination permease [Caloramator sp.]